MGRHNTKKTGINLYIVPSVPTFPQVPQTMHQRRLGASGIVNPGF